MERRFEVWRLAPFISIDICRDEKDRELLNRPDFEVLMELLAVACMAGKTDHGILAELVAHSKAIGFVIFFLYCHKLARILRRFLFHVPLGLD